MYPSALLWRQGNFPRQDGGREVLRRPRVALRGGLLHGERAVRPPVDVMNLAQNTDPQTRPSAVGVGAFPFC